MQRLAAQFGSETAFMLKPTDPGCDLRLRYFVPHHEMEMCGHATVGTVSVLAERGQLTASPVKIETPLGVIDVAWQRDHDGVQVTVEQFAPSFGEKIADTDVVAAALRIPVQAIALEVGPIQSVSVARPKLIVPLRERTVLDTIQPDFEKLWSLCDRYATTGFYPFTTEGGNAGTHAWARQFPKRAGYDEDPATGVAACALGAYLVQYAPFGGRDEGWHNFNIEQGHAMGRPSIIEVGARLEHGRIVATRMSGRARVLREEEITLAAG
jgi:PhzF family phenazine biosynthesis protein